jgi:hypothetical protein
MNRSDRCVPLVVLFVISFAAISCAPRTGGVINDNDAAPGIRVNDEGGVLLPPLDRRIQII